MQKRILIISVFVLLIPAMTLAVRPVVTLSSGLASANVYSSKIINFSPFQNTYVGYSHYDSAADSGLFIGGETVFKQNWAWQLGLSYFQNNSFAEQGNVYQFSDPAFNNLTYRYQIQSRRVAIDTKLSHVFNQIWHPYVSANLGQAINKAYQYTEYPVTSADAPMTSPFANHTTRTFTYSIGLGVDVNMAEHWRLGGGYRFVDLGSASLGMSPLQSGTGTLSNAHIHVNEWLAQLSYVG